MILEQHSYPSVSSTRITHLHRHLVQHDRVITAHYHLQFIDSLYRVVASRRRNTDFRTKGSRREPTRKRDSGEMDGKKDGWKIKENVLVLRSKLFRPRDYDIFHRFPQFGRYIGAFLTFRGSLLWGDASMHLNPSTNLLSILISSEAECTCHLLSSPRAGNNIVYHPSQCNTFSFPFFIFLLYHFIL